MWRSIRAEGYWEGEIWNKRKDGRVYLQRLSIACVKNELGQITHYVADGRDISERKRSEADRAAINAARIVQRTLFPLEAPNLSGFDIAGAVHPAESVSGDFFDYIPLGPDSIGCLVADVSGHGLGPALLMAQVQASLRALVEFRADPGELLRHANRLFAANDSGHFVTMFLGRLDAERRAFVYAGAGHQGYHFLAGGDVKFIEATGLPLGVVDVATVPSSPSINLEAGDIILLPTDGIEETYSPDGRLFGRQLMFEVIRNNREKSAAQIIDALFSAAREFAEGEPQRDDITAVVIKVLDPW
jgi:sigma-B regulation protein RsbU (phosphoserine phosphatase)